MPWLTVAEVAAHTGGTETTPLTNATAAAVAFVERERRDLDTGQAAGFVVTADVKLGAIMLAARLHERRGSTLGVVASAGYEEASQIVRHDPDIERLLQIGRSRPFGFGSAPHAVSS